MRNWLRRTVFRLFPEVERAIRLFEPGNHFASQKFCQYIGNDTVLTETFFSRYIYLDSTDISLSPHIMYSGRWEPHITELIIREIRRGDVFVDVGANCGFFGILAAHLNGSEGIVVAIEPQEKLARLMKMSFQVNGFPAARAVRMGVGKEAGTARLNKIDTLAGSATMFADWGFASSHEDVAIDTLPAILDKESAALGRPIVPTIVKIDVEGFEHAVWTGMKDMATGLADLLVIMEFTPIHNVGLGLDPKAIAGEFRDAGFALSVVNAQGAEEPFSDAHIDDALKRGIYLDLVLRKGRFAQAR